ncbi:MULTISPECIES: endonuclease/exonuclease/phosphatase family protein [unclassified Streptomyces]|uniref:endonuclease/exonuclease/phosphatase family protein n=1 Tax=unclassified Streptomyces TaxID=2593676 RepID=UPI000DD6011E|nr:MULTISPECIES: endonuclease/exonuclease/phosphatase family protein [unclassified Streptomyces]QZZ27208.1 endonuclease [Streptomyces sp. ST1015]
MLLGTWNLENLYRPGGPFGPKDKASYDTKLAALAETVDALAPDVLGVQEVGDPDALDDLLAVIGGTWHTALSEHPDGRGIRVGVISRTPLVAVADVDAFPHGLRPVQVDDSGLTVSAPGRGLLAVRTGTLHLAVAHLKSKLLTYPGNRFFPHDEGERARYGAYALYRRAAEAVALRALADDLLADDGRARDVAVVGDLNDEVQAATTQILLGPPGSEIGTPGYNLPDQGDRTRLWDVAPLIPADRRYSRVNSGRRELIDHILLSHQLVHRVTEADTGIPSADGVLRLPSVNEDPRERRDAAGSDHAPVWVRVG